MKHKLGSLSCCVWHFDGDGNPLPQCRQCVVCHGWVEHGRDNQECPGKLTSVTVIEAGHVFKFDEFTFTPTGRKQEAMQEVQQEPKLQGVREKIEGIRTMQHSTERENAFNALHADLDRIEAEIGKSPSSPDPDTFTFSDNKFRKNGEPLAKGKIKVQNENGGDIYCSIVDGNIVYPSSDTITLIDGKFKRGAEFFTGDIELTDPEGDTLLFGVAWGVMIDGPRMKPDPESKRSGVSEAFEMPTAADVAAKQAAMQQSAHRSQQGDGAIGTQNAAVGAQVPHVSGNIGTVSAEIGHASTKGEIPAIPIPDGIHNGSSVIPPPHGKGESSTDAADPAKPK